MLPFGRTAVLAVLLGAVGCDRRYGQDQPGIAYPPGVAAFMEDAPANRPVPPPDFPLTFVDASGATVDLAQYKDKSNVVLVVLRGVPRAYGGAFCEYCLAQSGSLAKNKAEFDARTAVVHLVFPGPTDRVREFVEAARNNAGRPPSFPFRMLLDKDLSATDRLAIRDDLAKPSTFIVDKKGDVVYAYVGSTRVDRPTVKAVLRELDRVNGVPPPSPDPSK
jgi:peroxiredoxin